MSLLDLHHRTIRYLRLSITPACPMRCVYCRPVVESAAGPARLLAPAEIESIIRHLVGAHGLEKVRLTGGEPTARADLLDIVRRLGGIEGLREVALTTNGMTLARQARRLVEAGLSRVNVSLDSLDPAGFERITGIDGLDRVLAGIDAAREAGLAPVKLNTVVVRGHNDHELPDLLSFAADRGLEIRFIELMPMGPLAAAWHDRFVPEEEMRRRLAGVVESYRAMGHGSSAARRYRAALADGRNATIGFITAMSCPFCAACDRIRIGARGELYPCLMDQPAGTLLPALRPEFNPVRLDCMLRDALRGKRDVHPATGAGIMLHIGG